jgi:hypothetical protein
MKWDKKVLPITFSRWNYNDNKTIKINDRGPKIPENALNGFKFGSYRLCEGLIHPGAPGRYHSGRFLSDCRFHPGLQSACSSVPGMLLPGNFADCRCHDSHSH